MLELELAAEIAAEDGAERPQHGAASASMIGTRPFACGWSGWGWLTSQKPTSAGRRNHAKRGRGRSPRRAAAPATATSGWIFWITTGVMKSPWKSASVKRIVAIADAPAPTATAAAI